MKYYSEKQYKEEMKLDTKAESLRAMARFYEALKNEDLIRWIEENPKYWEAIHSINEKDITKDLAVDVMTSLKKSHILELQMLWLFKCSNYLDLAGNLI